MSIQANHRIAYLCTLLYFSIVQSCTLLDVEPLDVKELMELQKKASRPRSAKVDSNPTKNNFSQTSSTQTQNNFQATYSAPPGGGQKEVRVNLPLPSSTAGQPPQKPSGKEWWWKQLQEKKGWIVGGAMVASLLFTGLTLCIVAFQPRAPSVVYYKPEGSAPVATTPYATTGSSTGDSRVTPSVSSSFITNITSAMHTSSVTTPSSDPTSSQLSQEDELDKITIKWAPHATKKQKEIVTRYMHLNINESKSKIFGLLENINAINEYGQTFLMLATECGDLESMKFALKHEADPTIQDSKGRDNVVHYLYSYIQSHPDKSTIAINMVKLLQQYKVNFMVPKHTTQKTLLEFCKTIDAKQEPNCPRELIKAIEEAEKSQAQEKKPTI